MTEGKGPVQSATDRATRVDAVLLKWQLRSDSLDVPSARHSARSETQVSSAAPFTVAFVGSSLCTPAFIDTSLPPSHIRITIKLNEIL